MAKLEKKIPLSDDMWVLLGIPLISVCILTAIINDSLLNWMLSWFNYFKK